MVKHVLSGMVVALSSVAAALAAELSPSRLEVKPAVLTIAWVGDCVASAKAVALAQKEASRIWSRADVILRWVDAEEIPFTAPLTDWVLVRCDARRQPPADAEAAQSIIPIAAIRFVDAKPTNTITVHLENAHTLLAREWPESVRHSSRVMPFGDVRIGRMIGRAVAHEIGHFVSQSHAHTRSGLMRATHTVAALTGASLRPFGVEPRHLETAVAVNDAPVFQY